MFGISLKPLIVIVLITGMWSLALLWVAFAQQGDEVDISYVPTAKPSMQICHLTAEGEVVSTVIQRDARASHFAHGDFLPDENGGCVFNDAGDGEGGSFSLPPASG